MTLSQELPSSNSDWENGNPIAQPGAGDASRDRRESLARSKSMSPAATVSSGNQARFVMR